MISVVRPGALSLLIGGSGLSRTRLRFRDEGAVQAFQIALAETLTSSGWFLCPTRAMWEGGRASALRRHR